MIIFLGGEKRKTLNLNANETENVDDKKKSFYLSPERSTRNLLLPTRPSVGLRKSGKNLKGASKFKDIVIIFLNVFIIFFYI